MTAIRIAYGDAPSQFIERLDGGSRGTIVLIHGGWWRDIHTLSLMDPLVERFHRAGWDVVNSEYRRTGSDGGGWPQTLEDVQAALDIALTGSPPPVVLVGHSAGGQLALLLAKSRPDIDAVVALAPVTDVQRAAREHLGEGGAELFLEGSDTDAAQPSPLRLIPIGVPQLVVHGTVDQRVPVQHSRDYAAATASADDADVTLLEIGHADHFALIDPSQQLWQSIDRWIDQVAPSA
jgi:acetyl esterase/lipase